MFKLIDKNRKMQYRDSFSLKQWLPGMLSAQILIFVTLMELHEENKY